MSPLGKGVIWLSILAETFRSCPVRRDQYASSVYVDEELSTVTCEFLLDIVDPPTTLRILDRFTVDFAGRIVAQENYFDPRNVTNPGWQKGPA